MSESFFLRHDQVYHNLEGIIFLCDNKTTSFLHTISCVHTSHCICCTLFKALLYSCKSGVRHKIWWSSDGKFLVEVHKRSMFFDLIYYRSCFTESFARRRISHGLTPFYFECSMGIFIWLNYRIRVDIQIEQKLCFRVKKDTQNLLYEMKMRFFVTMNSLPCLISKMLILWTQISYLMVCFSCKFGIPP